MRGSVSLNNRGIDPMPSAKFFLQSLKFVRGDENTIVPIRNVMRYLPGSYICRMLVYRIVPNANRTDVALFLCGCIVDPKKIVILVVHGRDGLHVPLHVHSFGAKFLCDREQPDQLLRFG